MDEISSQFSLICSRSQRFVCTGHNTVRQQNDISQAWMGTNWSGVCDELTKVSSPTLIITVNHDNNVPSANALIIAGKIPGAWLVQIRAAGHALIMQYPDKVNKVLQTFLSTMSS